MFNGIGGVSGQEIYRGEQLGDVVVFMGKFLPDVYRELHRANVLGDVIAIDQLPYRYDYHVRAAGRTAGLHLCSRGARARHDNADRQRCAAAQRPHTSGRVTRGRMAFCLRDPLDLDQVEAEHLHVR